MSKAIRISADTDFENLLKRLSNDIVTAPAFFRIHKQLGEFFQSHQREVNHAAFFWTMVAEAVRDTGLSRLARIYDQEASALSLSSLLKTIELNRHLFEDNAVKNRVNPDFVKNIISGSHFPDKNVLSQDIELVSPKNTLVKKVILWRNNFGAHISTKETIQRKMLANDLPNRDEAFQLCTRAFDVFNRYTSLFHATTHSRMIIGEEGSIESVFKFLRAGKVAIEKEHEGEMERLIKAFGNKNLK